MQTYNATDTVTLLAKTVRVRSLLFIGPPCTSGEEIEFENGRISDFHGLTLTLTLDPGMFITFFHLSSSTTCIPNFIEIEETFFVDGRTYGHTDVRKFATHSIRSTNKVWKST